MDQKKKAPAEGVVALPSCDRYARPTHERAVLTNITELLKNDEKNRLISLFFDDEKYHISSLSDYEYFAALCAILPRCAGTCEGDLLREELLVILENDVDFSNLSCDSYVRELWKKGNAFLLECHGEYTEILRSKCVGNLYLRECVISSFSRVEKYNEGTKLLSLLVDLRGLCFVRPDPYHASLAEEKMRAGESLLAQEESLLAAQAVYLAVTSDRERAVEIRLLVDGDGETARGLIEYLLRLGVRGRVLLAADGTMATDTLLDLIDSSRQGLSVRPELVLGKRDSRACLYARLLALSARYPISLWNFGGVLSESPLFFAGRLHMRRAVERVLRDVVAEEAEREELLAKIFS